MNWLKRWILRNGAGLTKQEVERAFANASVYQLEILELYQLIKEFRNNKHKLIQAMQNPGFFRAQVSKRRKASAKS